MLAVKEIIKMYASVSEDEFDEWFDNNIELLVEREKHQIIEAHNSGRNDKHNDFARVGEDYYREQVSSTCH